MKLKHDEPLSNFAFIFNLRRYMKAVLTPNVNELRRLAAATGLQW